MYSDIFFKRADKMLTLDEGCKDKPYKCTEGFITIGKGYNLDANGLPKHMIDELFKISLDTAYKGAQEVFGTTFDTFTERQKLGVVNMIFNLGLVRFKKFKDTIAYMKQGDFESARLSALNSLWAKQVKRRAIRVTDLLINKDTVYNLGDS